MWRWIHISPQMTTETKIAFAAFGFCYLTVRLMYGEVYELGRSWMGRVERAVDGNVSVFTTPLRLLPPRPPTPPSSSAFTQFSNKRKTLKSF